MSRLIVITDDAIRLDEVGCWLELLAAGVEKLHIRKPKASKEELECLVKEVPQEWRKKLVIHYQPELAEKYELGGLHVSFKDYTQYKNCAVPVSCSVHNWEEAREVIDSCVYCFISPVFDSISKTDYTANEELKQVPVDLSNKKIYALGGINSDNAGQALRNGYYGVVALGYVWNYRESAAERVKELLLAVNKENVLR